MRKGDSDSTASSIISLALFISSLYSILYGTTALCDISVSNHYPILWLYCLIEVVLACALLCIDNANLVEYATMQVCIMLMSSCFYFQLSEADKNELANKHYDVWSFYILTYVSYSSLSILVLLFLLVKRLTVCCSQPFCSPSDGEYQQII